MSSPSASETSAASPEPVKDADVPASEPAAAPEEEAQVRRVGWGTLPAEVVASIVQLVKAQDGLLKKKGIRRNRGIIALSLVNKQLRAMTIEYLPEDVPLSRLGEPLFRFGKVPDRLLSAVRTLNCQKSSSKDFIVAAPGLERLVNLEELCICASESAFLGQSYAEKKPASEFECQLTLAAFRENAGRIKRLSVQVPATGDTYYASASLMCQFTLPDVIEELEITSLRRYYSIFTAEGLRELQDMLHGCSRLKRLVVREIAEYCPTLSAAQQAEWSEVVHLPTLKSLSIMVTNPAVFSFIHSWAPNLETLKLDFGTLHEDPQPLASAADQEKPYTTFPSLRKLAVSGTPAIFAVLDYINLDAVKTLEVEIKHNRAARDTTMADFNIDNLVPNELVLPRGILFDLVVPYAYHVYSPPFPEGELHARLTGRDIKYRLWTVRPSAPHEADFLGEYRAQDDDGGTALESQRESICEVLTYAYHAVQWCDETADVAGMQELAEAVRPVYALMSRQRA